MCLLKLEHANLFGWDEWKKPCEGKLYLHSWEYDILLEEEGQRFKISTFFFLSKTYF